MAIMMKAGDTSPPVRATLLDENSQPVNITGASVQFVMSPGPGETPTVAAAAVLADAANGIVEYLWSSGDTQMPGTYVAEFEVVFSDMNIQTFPTQGYIDVTIEDDLGGTA